MGLLPFPIAALLIRSSHPLAFPDEGASGLGGDTGVVSVTVKCLRTRLKTLDTVNRAAASNLSGHRMEVLYVRGLTSGSGSALDLPTF